jgi:hypothetical protein
MGIACCIAAGRGGKTARKKVLACGILYIFSLLQQKYNKSDFS